MNARKVENISKNDVMVKLEDGNSVVLRPEGTVEDVKISDVSEVRKFLRITEDLGEIKPSTGKISLRD